jgi:subtilisin family serine protease
MFIKKEPIDRKKLNALKAVASLQVNEQPVFDDGKEFVVNLKKDVDYDAFWNQMETETNVGNIPNRPVRIFNERAAVPRSCHYVLTDEEAAILRNDNRISSVEVPPKYRPELVKTCHAVQPGNFSKPIDIQTATGDLINYGLTRVNATTDNYNGLITESKYNYTLDGTGVDIIVHDTGVEKNHPEFTDKDGVSRVKEIDWYVESGRVVPQRIPVNLANNPRFVATTCSTLQFDTTPTDSPFTTPLDYRFTLALGQVNGCLYGMKSAIKENGRMVHYSYYGGITTNWQSLGSVMWEVKFCDQNAIEVFVWRHDNVFSPWGLYLKDYTDFLDLSNFSFATQLQGPNAQAINFVLTTNDDGVTWECHGAADRPHHLELINGQWEVVPGTGYYPEFGYQLTPILQQTLVDKCVSIGSNFPFSFHISDRYTSPQSPYFYRDTIGHGTHVGGIIAGKNYGWAKNSDIYLMKVGGLEGPEGGGIDDPDCFDLIIEWHNNKPVDPDTGVKRPTIVNMSWGYGIQLFWYYPQQGIFRGQEWIDDGSLDLTTVGFPLDLYSAPSRVDTVDVSIEAMIDAGIHVCIASGNNGFKIDSPNGIDYDNIWSPFDTYDINNPDTWVYQHRGSSPYSTRALITGCVDAYNKVSGKETRVYFSNVGPGVDVYSPGHSIMSCTSDDTDLSGYDVQPYFLNDPDGHQWNQCNLSGTSMASPQTCGLGAVFLQVNPGATPEQLKQFIVANAKEELHTTGLNNDFESEVSVYGGTTKILHNKFNSPNPFRADKKP